MSMAAPRPGMLSRLFSRVARIEDVTLLKWAFVILLGGAAGMLAQDYFELFDEGPQRIHAPRQAAVLPAVERPEIDQNDPAFNPPALVTSSPEALQRPMEITLLSDGVLRLDGEIVPGTADRLAEEIALRAEYVRTISLNSPGGAVDEALAMAADIRAAGFETEVADGDLCASSCPLLFAAGVERRAGLRAVVGVHQAFATDIPVSAAQALSDMQSKTALISRQLISMGVDPALWLHALETPPDKLYYLRADEMLDLGLATEIIGTPAS